MIAAWTFVRICQPTVMRAWLCSIRIPDFFRSHECRHFEEFFERPNCCYYVMEQDGPIAGCGGYFLTENKALARLVLAWCAAIGTGKAWADSYFCFGCERSRRRAECEWSAWRRR